MNFLDDYPKRDFIISGFSHGFSVGWQGEFHAPPLSNFRIVEDNTEIAVSMVEKEIHLGRIAGPFDYPPFEQFQVSPLSLRPKKEEGKYRLIHDVSYPYDLT